MKITDYGVWIRRSCWSEDLSQLEEQWFKTMSVIDFEVRDCSVFLDGVEILYTYYPQASKPAVRMIILPQEVYPPLVGEDWLWDGNAWCSHLRWGDIVAWD